MKLSVAQVSGHVAAAPCCRVVVVVDDLAAICSRNESHGLRLPAAIFCRASPYRYGCIFKGCHVKRQARPLNTFKFINGEGYTPAILCNTSRGKKTRTQRCAQWCCSRYVTPKDLILYIRRCALRFSRLYTSSRLAVCR